MTAVNVRELARNTSKVIGDVARRKRPTIITRGGRPVAAVIPIDAGALEDWILANSPVFVRGMRQADAELHRSDTTRMTEALAPAGKRAARPGRRGAKPQGPAKPRSR